MRTIEERVAVVESRLDGGTQAFAELRKGIAEVSPRKTEWARVLSAIFGVCLAVGGLIYTVSDKFSERPRFDQLQGITDPIRMGMKAQAQRIEELRVIQYSQAASIKAIEKDIAVQARVLEALQKSRGKRR